MSDFEETKKIIIEHEENRHFLDHLIYLYFYDFEKIQSIVEYCENQLRVYPEDELINKYFRYGSLLLNENIDLSLLFENNSFRILDGEFFAEWSYYFFINDKFEKAFEKVKIAIQLNTEHLYRLWSFGKSFYDREEYKKAIDIFTTVNNYNEKDYQEYILLGLCHTELNQEREMEEAFLKNLKKVGIHPDSYTRFIKCLIKLDNLEKAESILTDIVGHYESIVGDFFSGEDLKENSSHLITLVPEIIHRAAEDFNNNKHYSLAMKFILKALELDKENSYYYYPMLGKIYFNLGEIEKAFTVFDNIITQNERSIEDYFKWARELALEDNIIYSLKAYSYINSFFENNPNQIQSNLNTYDFNLSSMAHSLAKLGYLNCSIELFTRAILVDPNPYSHHNYSSLASYYLELNLPFQAMRTAHAMQKEIRKNFIERESLCNLRPYQIMGEAYFHLNNKKKGNRFFEKALSFETVVKYLIAEDWGEYFYQMGEYKEAIDIIDRFPDNRDNRSWLNLFYIWSHYHLGNLDKVNQMLQLRIHVYEENLESYKSDSRCLALAETYAYLQDRENFYRCLELAAKYGLGINFNNHPEKFYLRYSNEERFKDIIEESNLNFKKKLESLVLSGYI